MTIEQKKRLVEIDELITKLQKEKEEINPYANLKSLSNKAFGEQWSEPHILEHCPNLKRDNGTGHDFFSEVLGRIEVKSVRLPIKTWTMNQVHPNDCDYFLFVFYDTIEGEAKLYLVPSKDIKEKFSYTAQHERVDDKREASCISFSGTKHNYEVLEQYRLKDWNDLDRRAGSSVGRALD